MLAVSSMQDSWPMLINFSVAFVVMQLLDTFNDRALRWLPLPKRVLRFRKRNQVAVGQHLVVDNRG
jgi:hypothetical protein